MHMPTRSLLHTHRILLDMTRQDFSAEGSSKPYVWQVRHGGMLGLKYEVAVRRDLLVEGAIDAANIKLEKMDVEHTNGHSPVNETRNILKSVVNCSVVGLGDSDDDVRSVAASTLVPVAEELVKLLPDELPLLLATLWDGLANMKDDLSSSVGAVMELLGDLTTL
jgi:TATA-binding protein-associated factor